MSFEWIQRPKPKHGTQSVECECVDVCMCVNFTRKLLSMLKNRKSFTFFRSKTFRLSQNHPSFALKIVAPPKQMPLFYSINEWYKVLNLVLCLSRFMYGDYVFGWFYDASHTLAHTRSACRDCRDCRAKDEVDMRTVNKTKSNVHKEYLTVIKSLDVWIE